MANLNGQLKGLLPLSISARFLSILLWLILVLHLRHFNEAAHLLAGCCLNFDDFLFGRDFLDWLTGALPICSHFCVGSAE